MKELGLHCYFLSIEVAYSPKGLLFIQKYIWDILSQAGLTDTKSVATPLEVNAKLAISDGTFLPGPTQYRLVVGILVYLTITRLDIAFAVHAVNRFVTTPTTIHWQPLCVLFVIFITQRQNAILSSSNSLTFIAYSNSDQAGNIYEKSTTGYCVFLGQRVFCCSYHIWNSLALTSTTWVSTSHNPHLSNVIRKVNIKREFFWGDKR